MEMNEIVYGLIMSILLPTFKKQTQKIIKSEFIDAAGAKNGFLTVRSQKTVFFVVI